MLNWALSKRRGGGGFTKIISNNYYICVEKAYLKDFSALTKINVEGKASENKH